jgi:hypothetical protein
MAAAIANATRETYEVQKAANDYVATGDAVDEIYMSYGALPSFTIETRPGLGSMEGFLLHPGEIDGAAMDCLAAILTASEYLVALRSEQSGLRSAWDGHRFNASLVLPMDANGNGVVDILEDSWATPCLAENGQRSFPHLVLWPWHTYDRVDRNELLQKIVLLAGVRDASCIEIQRATPWLSENILRVTLVFTGFRTMEELQGWSSALRRGLPAAAKMLVVTHRMSDIPLVL